MEKPDGAVGKYAKPVGRQPVTVPLLSPPQVPDWSEDTNRMLEALKPAHRIFVEWMSTGISAAEAYRKAFGDVESASACACNLMRDTPGVKEAITACLKDRNFGAKCDREWKLQKLKALIELCENSPWPADRATAGKLVMDMAKLQGEITHLHQVTEEKNVTVDASPALKRFMAAIEQARQKAAGVTVVVKEAVE